MRVSPYYFRAMDEDWARDRNLTALLILRSLLTSGVAIKNLPVAVKVAAANSASETAEFYTINRLGNKQFSADADAAGMAANRAVSAVADRDIVLGVFIDELRNDARLLENHYDPLMTPLWSDETPDWFTAADTKTREIWAADAHPENWTFWTKWWDAAIAGKPLNWELQRDVALIDDDVWKAGPGEVAKAIAGIEEKFSLLDQIAELKKQLLPVLSLGDITSATARQRAHNHPPELIDATASLHRYVIVILKDLDEAEAELEKPEPSASVLTRIGQQLLDITARVISYCAVLSDVVLRKVAETIATTGTKWAVGIIAADLVLPVGSFKALADGLIEFAKAWLTKG